MAEAAVEKAVGRVVDARPDRSQDVASRRLQVMALATALPDGRQALGTS